jgi:aminoglycoside 2'-N-acetyltransferase I
MTPPPEVTIVAGAALPPAERAELAALCTRAFAEDFTNAFDQFDAPTHVVARVGGRPVSHALWVPRGLDHGGVALRSAYVEAVATEPAEQGRGYATAVMRALAGAVAAEDAAGGPYDVGALAPSDPAFYARLGWENWRGTLFVRRGAETYETPDEGVMVLRLPRTPPLDLAGPLTAGWRPGEVW